MNRVLAENLYAALKQVKRTSIHSLPVLNYIRLRFFYGELHLTTTDLENFLTAKCACQLNEEWATCVPMVHRVTRRTFYPFIDYIKVMMGCADVLDLSFDPSIQILTVSAGTSRAEFKCLDAQEFPPVGL